MFSRILATSMYASRVIVVLTAIWIASPPSFAQDRSFLESFGQNAGGVLYTAAWPTATYRSTRFVRMGTGDGFIYAVFRLYGSSGFDGSDLWTDCIVTFRGLTPVQIRFGQNNGTLPPGFTAAMLKETLEELELRAKKAAEPPSQTWTVTDECTDKQGVYIRFFDSGRTVAWPDAEKPYHIERGKTRTFKLQVNPGQRICYGARSDKSTKGHWGLGLAGKEGCESCCYEASVPTVSIRLTCE